MVLDPRLESGVRTRRRETSGLFQKNTDCLCDFFAGVRMYVFGGGGVGYDDFEVLKDGICSLAYEYYGGCYHDFGGRIHQRPDGFFSSVDLGALELRGGRDVARERAAGRGAELGGRGI